MTAIGQIIKTVLEENNSKQLDNQVELDAIAVQCEQALLGATLVQLAELLGGNIELDNDGQAVIYTDILCAEA